jgi:hypothetical protein
MNDTRLEFEHLLLRELHAIQANQPAKPRRRRLPHRKVLAATALAALAAAGTTGTLILRARPAAAYDLHTAGNGPVLIEIQRPLSSHDLISLNHSLARAGVDQTVSCAPTGELHFTSIKPPGRPVHVHRGHIVAICSPLKGNGRELRPIHGKPHSRPASAH